MTTIYSDSYQKMCVLLREYREKKNLSQAQVGEIMGVDQTRVSKYESGQLRVDIIQLRLFCKAVGISLVDFVIELESRL